MNVKQRFRHWSGGVKFALTYCPPAIYFSPETTTTLMMNKYLVLLYALKIEKENTTVFVPQKISFQG